MFLAHEQEVPKDVSFSHKVQMVQTKINSYLHISAYRLTFPSNIKHENKINSNYGALHTHINRKRRWTKFQLAGA